MQTNIYEEDLMYKIIKTEKNFFLLISILTVGSSCCSIFTSTDASLEEALQTKTCSIAAAGSIEKIFHKEFWDGICWSRLEQRPPNVLKCLDAFRLQHVSVSLRSNKQLLSLQSACESPDRQHEGEERWETNLYCSLCVQIKTNWNYWQQRESITASDPI